MFQRSSRRFLAALFACSVGGAALWAIDTRAGESEADGPTTVEGARPYPAYRAPAFASGRPTLAFLAAGDTGWPGPMLDSVATAMDRVGSELPFSFVCLLGDNFYRNGVRSEVDGLWRTVFEDEFRGPHLCVPFHCALGNHDHNGNVQAQVEYSTRSTRWNMPGQYYTFVEPAGGDREAQFFVLDTEELRRDDGASAEQRLWLEDKLSRSTARWKIVMGHHPARSNGVHGSTSALRKSLEPLFERYGVALYLSGHDHDLELLETGRGYLQVVSGAGSKPRSMRWGDDTLFASAAPGFVWVGIEKDELWLVFVDAARGPVFSRCFERPELVACLTGGR